MSHWCTKVVCHANHRKAKILDACSPAQHNPRSDDVCRDRVWVPVGVRSLAEEKGKCPLGMGSQLGVHQARPRSQPRYKASMSQDLIQPWGGLEKEWVSHPGGNRNKMATQWASVYCQSLSSISKALSNLEFCNPSSGSVCWTVWYQLGTVKIIWEEETSIKKMPP